MKDLIRKILRDDLKYYHVSDASPEEDEYMMGEEDPKTDEEELSKKKE